VSDEARDLVARALAEDVGSGDVTTRAVVPEGARARATITQKAPGVVFGLDAAEEAFRQCDPAACCASRAGRRGFSPPSARR
jgi:nicotinate-nucleotide pyrophosphorylase (carboxylating)